MSYFHLSPILTTYYHKTCLNVILAFPSWVFQVAVFHEVNRDDRDSRPETVVSAWCLLPCLLVVILPYDCLHAEVK
jgi:hypothetical protein